MNEEIKQSIVGYLTNTPRNRERKSDVIKNFSKTYSEQEIVGTIEYLLDSYELLIKIDYESELDNNEIWYLYLASEEETKKYLSLRDIDKILLKILINHDTNGEIGQIRYDYVKSLLEEKGFSERELRRLWIDDITDFVWKTENGERVQWCYLVPEWEKTDSYKAARTKATERALEKESKWRLEDYERESHEKP